MAVQWPVGKHALLHLRQTSWFPLHGLQHASLMLECLCANSIVSWTFEQHVFLVFEQPEYRHPAAAAPSSPVRAVFHSEHVDNRTLQPPPHASTVRCTAAAAPYGANGCSSSSRQRPTGTAVTKATNLSTARSPSVAVGSARTSFAA
jgi:hypothetical protein